MTLLMHEFVHDILFSWLGLKEFLILERGSCKKMRRTSSSFLKSARFNPLYLGEIKSVLSRRDKIRLAVIKWLRTREVQVTALSLAIDEKNLEQLDFITKPLPYLFINDVRLSISLQPNYDNLVRIMTCYFPKTESIYLGAYFMRMKADDPSVAASMDELLKALLIIAPSLPLSSITFNMFSNMMESHVTLLMSLIKSIGSKLQHFQLPTYCLIPACLIKSVVEHCPNMRNLFPDNKFSGEVTGDMYISACRQLPKLESIQFSKAKKPLPFTDEEITSLGSCCPNLRSVSIPVSPLTAQSLVALLQLPHVSDLHMAGIAWHLFQKGEEKRSAVVLRCFKEVNFVEGHAVRFLQGVPKLSSLTFWQNFTISKPEYLSSMLCQVDCSYVETLRLDVRCFKLATHILPFLPNLTEVKLDGTDDDDDGLDQIVMTLVDTMTSHCPSIKRLSFEYVDYLVDDHVERLVSGLLSLKEVSFGYCMSRDARLTIRSLVALAQNNLLG